MRTCVRFYRGNSKPELEALDAQVGTSGFDSRTSWLTRVAIEALERGPATTQTELTELRRSRSELAAIGRNLNQIARALNIDALSTGPDTDALQAAIAAIQEHKSSVVALVQKIELRGRR